MLYLHNFTGVYNKQDFYKDFNYKLFNDEKLVGVRGYMDDDVKACLINEIKTKGKLSSIHFLDSGNYHHLSRIYIELINESFNLVVYDNHTDMQFSAFGNILSCGSWIADAYTTHKNLNKIFIVGADKRYIEDCKFKNDERVVFIESIMNIALDKSLPVYISVDKDVLSKDEFVSDWDHGKMSVATLIGELKYLIKNIKALGVDICGEPATNDNFNIDLSNHINKELTNIFVDILY